MSDEYIHMMEALHYNSRREEQQERVNKLLYLNNYKEKEVSEHIANLLIILD